MLLFQRLHFPKLANLKALVPDLQVLGGAPARVMKLLVGSNNRTLVVVVASSHHNVLSGWLLAGAVECLDGVFGTNGSVGPSIGRMNDSDPLTSASQVQNRVFTGMRCATLTLLLL